MANRPSSVSKPAPGIKVTVKQFGPTGEQLAAIGERALTLASVRKRIGRGKARLLYVEALDDDEDKGAKPRPPSRFRATLYDDMNHRAVLVDGSLRDPHRVDVTESAMPPHPSDAEYAAAVKIVRKDTALAASLMRSSWSRISRFRRLCSMSCPMAGSSAALRSGCCRVAVICSTKSSPWIS